MSRLQLALNVNDIDEAVAFYSKLFGTEPAKTRPGYANFAIAEPPLKLVLLENPGQGGTLNHLGIEVPDTDAVNAVQARLTGTGVASVDERDTTCCYARQDKFWVEGVPDGRVLGGLHGPGRQPDLLRRRPRAALTAAAATPARGRGPGRFCGEVLLAGRRRLPGLLPDQDPAAAAHLTAHGPGGDPRRGPRAGRPGPVCGWRAWRDEHRGGAGGRRPAGTPP